MSGRGLELRSIVKHFRGGEVVRAVDGVSLTIAPGEMVALHGPSGSGKSTLLMIAGGYIAPDAGSVRFDGREVTAFSPSERSLYQRRDVGLVQQSFHLNAGATAVDNTAVKLLADRVSLDEARRRAIPWLERVGLGGRLSHTPNRMSGGEAQRVALARALVNEPNLVLADEPTAFLDRRRGAEVVRLLADIAHEREIAVLLVTHDRDAATLTDRTCSLTDGVLAEGPASSDAHGPIITAAGGE